MSEYYYIAAEKYANQTASGVFLRLGYWRNGVSEYGYMPEPYRKAESTEVNSNGIFITSSGNFVLTALEDAHLQYRGDIETDINGGFDDTNSQGDVSVYLDGGDITIESNKNVHVESDTGSMVFDAERAKASVRARHVNSYTVGQHLKKLGGTLTKIAKGGQAVSTNVSLSLMLTYYQQPTLSLKAGLTISVCPFSISAVTMKVSAVAAVKLSIYAAKSWKYTMDDVAFTFCYAKIRGFQFENVAAGNEAKALGKLCNTTITLFQAGAHVTLDNFKFAMGITSDLPG